MVKIIDFIKRNPFVSLIVFLLLVIIIIVALSKPSQTSQTTSVTTSGSYTTQDFVVTKLANGKIIVQTLNSKYKDLTTIKNTLGIPADVEVILDIPGAMTGAGAGADLFTPIPSPVYQGDLSKVGD